jgi:predicted neutral ceramidase superfamily lipid hydrolase
MEARVHQRDKGREESEKERLDRNLQELLGELRVALPGVQVLFAFLLTIPFAQRFTTLDASDRRIYFAAVLATAAATMFLIAPTAHHRLRFRDSVKEHLLRVANVFTVLGLVCLAFSVTAATYVIADVVYPGTLPRIVAASLAGAFVLGWLVVPLLFRPRATPERDEAAGTAAHRSEKVASGRR